MNKLINFSFFFIGLNSCFFIFREVFFPLKIVYTACLFFLAIRILFIPWNKSFYSKNILLGKFAIYFISLVVSISYSASFFFNNLSTSYSILFLACIFLFKTNNNEFKYFFYGYKISLIINFIYAGFELLFLLSYNISITSILIGLLGFHDRQDVSIYGRIAGLMWDPYLLGIFCATGFFLFKSNALRLYILVLLYYSGSRSGQIGLLAGLVYYYSINFKYKSKLVKSSCIVIGVFLIASQFIDFKRGFGGTSKDGDRRLEYVTYIPQIWDTDETFINTIIGGAPMYSGGRFWYSNLNSATNRTIKRDDWIIESDWSGILLGRGIIGFLYYLLIYIMIIANQKDRNIKAICLCIFFAGIGYNYDLAIFINFILYFASSYYLNTGDSPTICNISSVKNKLARPDPVLSTYYHLRTSKSNLISND